MTATDNSWVLITGQAQPARVVETQGQFEIGPSRSHPVDGCGNSPPRLIVLFHSNELNRQRAKIAESNVERRREWQLEHAGV